MSSSSHDLPDAGRPNRPRRSRRRRANDPRLRRLEQIIRAGADIMAKLGHLPLNDVLDLIARHAAETLHAEAASILLVKRPEYLTLVADFGYTRRPADEFKVQTGPGLGLTGHVAHQGQLFNECGPALNNHPAARRQGTPEAPSGQCYSLLMLPFFDNADGRLVGLLRVENKKNEAGQPDPGRCFTDEDEWLIGYLAGIVLRSTERALLIDQLQREKAHTARLLADAPNAVIAIDRHGRVTLYNGQAQAILGYPPEDVIGQPVEKLYANVEEARRVGALLRNAPDGRLTNIETTVRARPDDFHPDGELVPVRLDATVFRNGNDYDGSVGYFEDLRAIRDIERRLALLLDAGNLVVRADGLEAAVAELEQLLMRQLRIPLARVFLLDDETLPVGTFLHRATDPAPAERLVAAENDAFVVARPGDVTAHDPLNRATTHQYVVEALAGGPRRVDAPAAVRYWRRGLGLDDALRALQLVPLHVGDRPVGLLCLGDHRHDSPALFDAAAYELATAVANQTAALIDSLRLQEQTSRHRDLLHALERATRIIRFEKQMERLMPEVVRLAVEVVGLDAGALYLHNPHLGVLTLSAVYGLPAVWRHRTAAVDGDLLSRVVATGQMGLAYDVTLRPGRHPLGDAAPPLDPADAAIACGALVALPLKLAGDVAAVLAVGQTAPGRRLRRVDLEILHSLATHASLALRQAQLLGQEERTFRQLDNLRQLNLFFQTTTDPARLFRALLTGVTAGYGLEFNRAALFLRDEVAGALVCRAAVGHVDEAEARLDWARSIDDDLFDIARALGAIERGELPATPLAAQIDGLSLPEPSPGDLLHRVLHGRACLTIEGDELAGLPVAVWRAFDPDPALPLIMAPLLARGRAIGFIIADNRFTRAPITNEDSHLLFTFANAGALAIDNARRQEEQTDLHRAADDIARATGMDAVLRAIVVAARHVLRAHSAAFWYYDQASRRFILQHSVADGIPAHVWNDFRRAEPQPGQTAHTVLAEGWLAVENVADPAGYHFLSDGTRQRLLGIGVHSLQGIVLTLRDQPLGVLYVNYGLPRAFSDEARAAIRAFADQAAPALEKAWLMEQLHKSRDAARLIAAVMAAASLDEALQAVADSTRQVLGCGPVTLYAYDARRQRLRYPPTMSGVRNKDAVRRLETVEEDSVVADVLRDGGTLLVSNIAEHPRFATSRFTRDEGVVSVAAVALEVAGERVGVMFVNYLEEHRFTGDDRKVIEHFADSAAVAIRLAHDREQAAAYENALDALRAVGQMVIGTHDRQRVLEAVAEWAWRLVPGVTYASVSLVDDGRLVPVAAYPPQWRDAVRQAVGDRRLDGQGRRGVTGRAVLEGETQRVLNVADDDDYLAVASSPAGSELAAPINVRGRAQGVINIEHPDTYAFSVQHEFALEALAHDAGAAIAMTDAFAELARANSELERNQRQLAIAMAEHKTERLRETYGHFVSNRVNRGEDALNQVIAGLRVALAQDSNPDLLLPILRQVQAVHSDMEEIQRTPLDPHAQEAVESVPVRQVLNQYMAEHGRRKEESKVVSFVVECAADDSLRVPFSPVLLAILDGMVDNAIAAMVDSDTKQITLAARLERDDIHILVTDTGKGIDPELRDRLFSGLLYRRTGRRRQGIGLTLAWMLVHAYYSGDIDVASYGPGDTTFVIILPIDRGG